MTLDHLRYFTSVATYQHVGRAAVAISISPSVISSAIATLEDELQCELFRKNGRGIELTDHGKKLLERSKAILQSITGLKTALKGEPQELAGHYRLGASHFLSSRQLFFGWDHLQKSSPKLTADIYSMNTAHAIAEVLYGRLDLAVCFSPLTHPDLKEHRITTGQLVTVVRKNHPILKKSSKEHKRFLSGNKAIIHKSKQGVESCETHPVFDELGFQPSIDIYFDSDDIAIQAVIHSDRWSFVPDMVASSYADKLQILDLPRITTKAPYHISAVVRSERCNELVLQKLVESLRV